MPKETSLEMNSLMIKSSSSLLCFLYSFLAFMTNQEGYAIVTDPNGDGHGATVSGTDDWSSNQTYYWDFSQADNYVDGSVQQNFDTWEITSLTKGSGKLTIEFSTWETGFGSGSLTGDYGQEDDTAQINYVSLQPSYWFNDIVEVTGGDSFDVNDIALNNAPGGASNWVKHVNGNKLSLQFKGSWPASYSAVPEPSTYMMVSGLLALPVLRFWRRWRNKSSEE